MSTQSDDIGTALDEMLFDELQVLWARRKWNVAAVRWMTEFCVTAFGTVPEGSDWVMVLTFDGEFHELHRTLL